jgi:glycosyltransferase involved in cell wall biosynthesis
VGDPEPGFVHELARRLIGRFRVIVLCPHAQGALASETMDGVEVVRYRYAPASLETLVNDGGVVTNLRRQRWKWLLVPGFVLMQAWVAWRLCRMQKVAAIHAHWLIPQGLIAAALRWLPGTPVPFIVTSHGADLYALQGRGLAALKRWVLRCAGAATVVSTAMRDEVAALGADVGKVSVLPMGVDMHGRFQPPEGPGRSSSELLFVGRLVEKKGLRYLLDALPAVLRERPEVTLTIAGFGPDEPALRAQVAAKGLSEAVHFLGAVPQQELPELYQSAALFVAPFVRTSSGDQEGLPVALTEAVACGCPAIAGNVQGLADVFGASVDDCIVDPREDGALATAILRVLGQPDHAAEQAIHMRAALLDCLDWSVISQCYGELVSQLDLTPQAT